MEKRLFALSAENVGDGIFDISLKECSKESHFEEVPPSSTATTIIPGTSVGLEIMAVYETVGEDEESDIIYEMKVTNPCGEKRVKVKGRDLQGLRWLNDASGGLVFIDKFNKAFVVEFVSSCLQNGSLRITKQYQSNGWHKICDDWKYVLSHGVVGDESLNVIGDEKQVFSARSSSSEVDIYKEACGMLEICRQKNFMWVAILYVLCALCTTLYNAAGFPLKFVLALVGETNSRKTSLALLLGKVFNSDELSPDVSFTATKGGIEMAIYEHRDSIVIIDDMTPGVSLSEKKANTEKLELVMRLYGDGTAKRRMAGVGRKKDKHVSGGCILTGEVIDGVESSFARRIQLNFNRNEINNALLSKYQENPIWSTFIYNFLSFITKNSDIIVNFIRERVERYRKMRNYRIGRRNEQYAQLATMAELCKIYGEKLGILNKEMANMMLTEALNAIDAIISDNEDIGRCVSPITIIVEAFRDLEENSPERILNEGTYLNDARWIYQTPDYFCIYADMLLNIVIAYTRKRGTSIALNTKIELIQTLKSEELIKVAYEGTKQRTSFHLPGCGSGKRFIWIKKSRYYDILARIEDFESEL